MAIHLALGYDTMRKLNSDTRSKIISTAVSMMATHDFHSLTTKEVAQTANIAETTLFRYFPRKETLFLEILTSYAQSASVELDALLETIPNALGRLRRKLEFKAEFAQRHQLLVRAVERELMFTRDTSNLIAPICLLFRDKLLQDLKSVAIEEGINPDLDLELVVDIIEAGHTVYTRRENMGLINLSIGEFLKEYHKKVLYACLRIT